MLHSQFVTAQGRALAVKAIRVVEAIDGEFFSGLEKEAGSFNRQLLALIESDRSADSSA